MLVRAYPDLVHNVSWVAKLLLTWSALWHSRRPRCRVLYLIPALWPIKKTKLDLSPWCDVDWGSQHTLSSMFIARSISRVNIKVHSLAPLPVRVVWTIGSGADRETVAFRAHFGHRQYLKLQKYQESTRFVERTSNMEPIFFYCFKYRTWSNQVQRVKR